MRECFEVAHSRMRAFQRSSTAAILPADHVGQAPPRRCSPQSNAHHLALPVSAFFRHSREQVCPAPLRYRWAAIRRGTSAWFWTRACAVRMMAALSGFCACARHAAMRCRSPQICPRHLDRPAAKTAFISEDSGESARCRNAGTRKSHPTGRGGPGEPVRDLLTDVYARADWLDTD